VGVDPVSREEFWDILKKLNVQGISMLISTPYMNEAAFCDRLVLFHKGSILVEGEPQELCLRYPLNLYAADTESRHFSYLSSLRLPSGIELVYYSKGRLYIASALSLEDTASRIESILPSVDAIAAEKPGIEDFFMYRFLKAQEAPGSVRNA
jgi:ABC-type multidrug transport system ATPase subunit